MSNVEDNKQTTTRIQKPAKNCSKNPAAKETKGENEKGRGILKNESPMEAFKNIK
jgi:hypothetical protein